MKFPSGGLAAMPPGIRGLPGMDRQSHLAKSSQPGMDEARHPMRRIRRFLIRSCLVLAVLALAALVAVGWQGSGRLVSPARRALQDYHHDILGKPADHGLKIVPFTAAGTTPCLLVTASPAPGIATKSNILRDELARRGVRVPPWGAELGTVVLLYGHGGRKEDHLPICERFCAAGFRCLLLDLPGQGDHPAAVGSFGLHEAELVETVLADASRRFAFDPAPACLFGVSQGGAIALQTAARSPLKWKAVASVATFASLDRPVSKAAENLLPGPLRFCSPLAAFSVGCGTRLRAGFWPADVRPVDAAGKLNQPVFIGHGELDASIGIDQARAIFAAIPGGRKKFRVVTGADHNHVLSKGSHALYADLCHFFLAAVEQTAVPFERAE
jgi:pimeloyl-ACP methyl ester carboxylesterase